MEYNHNNLGCVITNQIIGGAVKDLFFLQKHNVALSLPSEEDIAYSTICPKIHLKVDDLKKIIQYILGKYMGRQL